MSSRIKEIFQKSVDLVKDAILESKPNLSESMEKLEYEKLV